jgi:16S rRNA (cytosine967-C5)-methyltransferase
VLRAVRRATTFEAALDAARGALSEADRRLAHELAAGVLRSRGQLDHVIAPRVTHGWRRVNNDLRDLLRLGAYQLTVLDRIPPHAAVASTVELAKREFGPKSAGFVNAVLRRLVREISTDRDDDGKSDHDCSAAAPPASGAPFDQRFSHPAWLVARWLERFGEDRTAALLEHNNRRPNVYLQPARGTLSQLREELTRAGVPFQEREGIPGLAVTGGQVRDLPGYQTGTFIVQDPAQARAMAHAAIADGALVWDACAAPGGKAASLAQRCRVVASDVSRARVERLVNTVRRAAPTVRVVAGDALRAPFASGGMDVVLVDAPCSGTGAIAKHPDARWRLSTDKISRLSTLQSALLRAVAPMVRPGGALIYLTCSLEREENELQIECFLNRHPEFRRDGDDLFIFPPDDGTDGAFAARMVRSA